MGRSDYWGRGYDNISLQRTIIMNLVFASGFLFPQSLLGIDYFRGLRDHIVQAGMPAPLFPKVPPIGGFETRAQALADAILQAYPVGPIHIIAHSMGGLDSRTLIGRNHHGLSDPGRIASLTTVATPHRGSPVADLLADPGPDDAGRRLQDRIKEALDRLGIDVGALRDLTAEGASRVPDVTQTHPHIRYHSFFASGRQHLLLPPTCALLLPTHEYIRAATGQDNDGLVTLDSARYGEFQEPFWHGDHIDICGHNLDTADLGVFRFDHFAAYDAIIRGL
jgi:triacylglycerol lipase